MRCCLFCEHFRFDPGVRGYSEYTPGECSMMSCSQKNFKSLFGMHNMPHDLPEFLVNNAADCSDYALSDYAKEKGIK